MNKRARRVDVMGNTQVILLDCTLRDGGYYNSWDFSPELIQDYLQTMQAVGVDIVEMGFRTLKCEGFRGACAYTTDDFVRSFVVPSGLQLGVMINAAEILSEGQLAEAVLARLFPEAAATSPISMVRVACHAQEFKQALKASSWLQEKGYRVGFNIMQIANYSTDEVESLARIAADWPIDVLYFADSMGSMKPNEIGTIIHSLRKHWQGALGIHTHDNMGAALSNTFSAIEEGVTWVDSTVTGMGRGPGNAKTEYLGIEIAHLLNKSYNLAPLLALITRYFAPLQRQYAWGSNAFYYLSGKYCIHPTYVQEMLGDLRYTEEDILTVVENLRIEGGKKFNPNKLVAARHFFQGAPHGTWMPADLMQGREVLLLGAGPGVAAHRGAIESYVRKNKPFVMALNTQSQIDAELIDVRVACHPVRLQTDCEIHVSLPQPLVTPASMLPADVKNNLASKELLDFGLGVQADTFQFFDTYAILPTPLVLAYALAVATSGQVTRILLAGFDGYGADDPRRIESDNIFYGYEQAANAVPLLAVTPTLYRLPASTIYALN